MFTFALHTNSIIDQYFEALEPVFELIKECEDGREVQSLLDCRYVKLDLNV